ncbi:calcium-binding protein, partial [Sphingomonas sp. HF-S3]
MEKFIYLDTNLLQSLIEGGIYDSARAAAAAQGYEFRTTTKIIQELGASPHTSDEVRNFIKNAEANIRTEPHPSSAPPTGKNAGELGIWEIIKAEREAGITTSEIWTSDAGIMSQIRSSVQYRDIPIKSLGMRRDVHGKPVPSAIEFLYGHDPLLEHQAIEAIKTTNMPNHNLNPDPTKFTDNITKSEIFRTAEQLGVERYTRVNGPIVEQSWRSTGDRPSGDWKTDVERRATAAAEARRLLDAGQQKFKSDVDAIRSNASSYDAEGNYTAGASENLARANKALQAAGVAAGVWDALTTGNRIKELNAEGRHGDAAIVANEFLGRMLGGMYGAELGMAVLGKFGPWAGLFGALAGGAVGAIVGEEALRAATEWILEAIGASFRRRDPLVLDLNFDGARLTSLTGSGVNFDLDGDGFAERTGWVSARDGFLALDHNGNGLIDNGLELFGTSEVDGFTVLAELDSNNDRVISAADARFSELRVWQDLNLDGVSQSSEIMTLAQAGVVSINLNAQSTKQVRAENSIRFTGSFTGPSGLTGEVIAVDFATDQINTSFVLPPDFEYDPEVFGLPNLRGYGLLPDLWVSMSLDPVLKQMVKDLINGEFTSIDAASGHQTSITHPPVLNANGGLIRDGWIEYDYEASAFDDMLARWARFTVTENTADKYQIVLFGEVLANRVIFDHVAFFSGTPVTNSAFFQGFEELSAGFAARFFTQVPDMLARREILALIDAFSNATPANGEAFSLAEYEALASQVFAQSTASALALDPDLALLQGLTWDYKTDQVIGDAKGVIDRLMSSLPVDPQAPWAGYANWILANRLALSVIDPDGSVTLASYRAHTGNHALPILVGLHNVQTGTAQADTLYGSANPLSADLMDGGAGNDVLRGGNGDDTYVFYAGSGQDIVEDSGGTRDEIAFQGVLSSTEARFSFAGSSRSDLLISFEGRDESVLVKGYFTQSGAATIEAITFADGVTVSQREIRDAALYAVSTNGNDTIAAFELGSRVAGGPGNDLLTGNAGNDVFESGAGNDVVQGGGGDDTYRFFRGDGADVISEYELGGSGFDTLEFGAGISADNVIVSQTNNGLDIVIKVAGTNDQVTISYGNGWYHRHRIDQVVFRDGTTWSFAQLLERARAATDGNDSIFGSFDEENIGGGAGDDVIVAGDGSDRITGGTGNDTLYGGGGADSYFFNLGDGEDVINEYEYNGNGHDRIIFGPGIDSQNITALQSNNGQDIVLSINGTTDKITIKYGNGASYNYRVDEVVFSDGTSWSFADLLARATIPTAGNDTLYGSLDGETLSGAAGDDWISAGAGNDVIAGGAGNDTLYGGSGDDTYQFNPGDGRDVISESGEGGSGNDRLVFGAGINASDVSVSQANDGYDFVLNIAGTTDQVTMRYGNVSGSGYRIETVAFADGTLWSLADLVARLQTPGNDIIRGRLESDVINAGAGDDVIRGEAGNDDLSGGTGDDTIYGGAGDDIYRFNLGDGRDIISESGEGGSGSDRLVFGAGIDPSNVSVSQANDGYDFVLRVGGSTDQVTMRYTNVAGNTSRIETVEFADGTSWSLGDLLARLPTEGNDTIRGRLEGDVINGGAGNDIIRGEGGNDDLTGGAGNDTVYGGAGDDIYRFNLGDGRDIISEYGEGGSGLDALVFGPGVDPSSIVVSQANNGLDIVIAIAGTSDQVTISNGNNSNGNARIEEVRFANGTVWSFADILARASGGTPGNDTLYGSSLAESLAGGGGNDWISGGGGADILSGGTGNDTLYGGAGDDVYHFDLGDGQDVISEYGEGGSGTDKLVFGTGISASDVIVTQADNGYDFVLKIAGTTDQVTMRYGNYST